MSGEPKATIKTHDCSSFSNGTEYQLFLEKNCNRCRKFVDWEDATKKKPECPIEKALAEASWDLARWPAGGRIKINEDINSGGFFIPHCLDFEPDDQAEKALWEPGG